MIPITKADYELGIAIMKIFMKPGYLYGIGKDGELYSAKVEMPDPGQTLVMPPMHMPSEEELEKQKTYKDCSKLGECVRPDGKGGWYYG